MPTPEEKTCTLPSVYALTKYDTERLALLVGRAYDIPTVALRFFNTYGPRQALSNPYTGVLAIFAARLLNNRAPLINEDGRQRRDFVSVHDVARACRLALETDAADGLALNVGQRALVHGVARWPSVWRRCWAERASMPEITGNYRVGDIRHCFADISRARQLLGYEPQVVVRGGAGRAGRLAGSPGGRGSRRGGARRALRAGAGDMSGRGAARADAGDARSSSRAAPGSSARTSPIAWRRPATG